MKRVMLIFAFFLLASAVFSTTVSFKLNMVCKNDEKLLLKDVQLTDDATIISFLYTNDKTKNKTIGVFPPSSANSMFLYNQDGTKIYYLKDIKKLPKWWPQKKYVLNRDEKLEFQLIFEKIDPTLKINIVEGKNNFKSTTGWLFLDLPVNSYDFLAKKTVEILQKNEVSEDDQILLNSYRGYEFVNDFISYFKNKNQDIRKLYITKWRNNPKARYFIDFILKEEVDNILSNNDMDKALELIDNYPNTLAIVGLKKRMKPIIEKEMEPDYYSVKDSNSPSKYIEFINKYSKYQKDFPDITYIGDIQTRLKSFIENNKKDLLTKKDATAYNDFFKKYGISGSLQAIYVDYESMAKEEYTNVELENTPAIWYKFLQNYPYSVYVKSVHKKFYEYFKKNPNNISLITKYVGEYPDSPYLQEIIQIIPQATTVKDSISDSLHVEQVITPPKPMTLEEKIQAFKNSTSEGALLHYREKVAISNAKGGKEKYVIIYEVKVLNVLSKTIRIEIVDASLADPNPSQQILSEFGDLKEVMIGTIEKMDFQKFDEFKNY